MIQLFFNLSMSPEEWNYAYKQNQINYSKFQMKYTHEWYLSVKEKSKSVLIKMAEEKTPKSTKSPNLTPYQRYSRVRSRFFDQVGHQTTNASIGNKYFFTK